MGSTSGSTNNTFRMFLAIVTNVFSDNKKPSQRQLPRSMVMETW